MIYSSILIYSQNEKKVIYNIFDSIFFCLALYFLIYLDLFFSHSCLACFIFQYKVLYNITYTIFYTTTTTTTTTTTITVSSTIE